MKMVLSLLGMLMLLAWPVQAQDDPPDPPAPGAVSAAPAGPPAAPGDFRGPRGMRRMGPGRMSGGVGMGFGAWWKNSETVAKLQLTDDQVKKIEQAFYNHRLKLVDLRADLEKQELQLRPLLDADHPDEPKVAAQIDQITMARGRLEKERAMMMLGIRRVLTLEQWKKLQTLKGPGPGMRRDRGDFGSGRGPRSGGGFGPPS
jgi:Spy/CpxP family protein refolding chaperone